MRPTLARRLILVFVLVVGVAVPSFAAARPTARTAVRCAEIYWRSIRNGDVRCPYYYNLLSDVKWHLHWRYWNRYEARAVGVEINQDYWPSGRDLRERLIVHLTRPRVCPDGTTIYTRISMGSAYLYNGRTVPYHRSWSYACDGSGSGSGG